MNSMNLPKFGVYLLLCLTLFVVSHGSSKASSKVYSCKTILVLKAHEDKAETFQNFDFNFKITDQKLTFSPNSTYFGNSTFEVTNFIGHEFWLIDDGKGTEISFTPRAGFQYHSEKNVDVLAAVLIHAKCSLY